MLRYRLHKIGYGHGDAKIATAQAQLSQAQIALEGTKLYAPFDGIVAYKNIRENEYYSTQSVSSQLSNYQGLLDRVPIVVIDPSQFEVTADLIYCCRRTGALRSNYSNCS